jgi:hypothetical protein
MAHFAEIDNTGTVVRVLVVPDEQESRGQEFLAKDLNLGGTWVQTSYNTKSGEHKDGKAPLRKNYAGVGYTYDARLDAFIPPKPFPSWILDQDTCNWNPPVAAPEINHEVYPDKFQLPIWKEETRSWELVSPAPSWVKNEETKYWSAPVDYPADGGNYLWNEEKKEWETFVAPEAPKN